MIRIVRTRTLRALRTEAAVAHTEATAARVDAEALRTEAGMANDSAIRAEADVEALRTQLAEALDAAEVQFAGLHAVIRQVTGERDAARRELAEWRRVAGADPAEPTALTAHQDQDARHAAAESAAAVLAAEAARTSKETDQ